MTISKTKIVLLCAKLHYFECFLTSNFISYESKKPHYLLVKIKSALIHLNVGITT